MISTRDASKDTPLHGAARYPSLGVEYEDLAWFDSANYPWLAAILGDRGGGEFVDFVFQSYK